ncbi:MAG: ribosome-associated translation inhibitor RaiA [Mailhella sp.]|nr:ribosome-associated translation inhibitor RaiA [Mailhella sp.]
MKIDVIYRGVTPSDAISAYANKRFQKAERLAEDADLQIVLSPDGKRFNAAASLSEDGKKFSASESNDDMYAAIDICCDKLCQQLRKASEKDSLIDRSSVRNG